MNEEADLVLWVSSLLNCEITGCEPVASGRNSRIYRMADPARNAYAVKHYFQTPARRSLDVEYAALRFLNDSGITSVPRAIAVRSENNLAVYSYVEGVPCSPTPTDRDVTSATEFILKLDKLGACATAWEKPAVDACFAMSDAIENIRARMSTLMRTHALTTLHHDMRAFVNVRLSRLLETVIAWAETQLPLSDGIPDESRILSPSDFGFHNAIRTHDGTLAFVDFEFFGWDDPAKLIADFLLHPAMQLCDGHKRLFAGRLRDELRGGELLAKRLPVAYSFHALKWCLILLNEFVPEHLARRRFAGETRNEEYVLAEQLTRAQRMADHIAETYRSFRYFG